MSSQLNIRDSIKSSILIVHFIVLIFGYMNSETIISSTGAKLNVYSLLPQKEVKAIIHIAHGMVEHALGTHDLLDELCQSGYAVYSHDIRGHGHTKAQRMRLKESSQNQMVFNSYSKRSK